MNKMTFLIILILFLYSVEFFLSYRRNIPGDRKKHLLTNFLMVMVSSVSVRAVIYFIVFFEIDIYSFNTLRLPENMHFLYLIILDFFIYIQHVLSHRWNWFWAFHKVHHADHFLDTSSGVRFHPGEILISYFYKIGLVILLGIPKDIFLIYELMLSSLALFNHSNIRIPKVVDKYLRLVIVTPSFHFVHHSKENHEMNSHFGNTLSIWDRLFKTYRKDSLDNENQDFGLKDVDIADSESLRKMLLFPLSRD